MSASATTVKFGGSVTLSGKLAGGKIDAKNVTVREDPFPIDAFANGGSATTNATGDWTLAVNPTANTRYQARSGKAESPAVDVMVRPAISLKLSDRTPKRGQRVASRARSAPSTTAWRSRSSGAPQGAGAPSRSRARGCGGDHLLLVRAQPARAPERRFQGPLPG